MFPLFIENNKRVSNTKPIVPYGTMYDKSSWANTSDFTNLTGATISLSGNSIQINGNNTTAVVGLTALPNTCLDREYQKVVFDVGVVDSGNSFGIGRYSTNTKFSSVLIGSLITSTGQIYINNVVMGTIAIPHNNDLIQLELDFNQQIGTSTITITNLTQGTNPISFTYTYIIGPFPASGLSMPNTGRFAVYLFGTTPVKIKSYFVSSNSVKNAKFWVAGDSKGVGRYASSMANGFSGLLLSKYGASNCVNGSGGADATADVLHRIPQIISFSPQKVLLEIGSNDLRFNISEPTFEANYKSIVSQLQAAGIDVYHLLTMPESDENLTTQKNFINSTFPKNKIIDTWTPLVDTDGHSLNPIYWGDNVGLHYNDAGHKIVFNKTFNFFGNNP